MDTIPTPPPAPASYKGIAGLPLNLRVRVTDKLNKQFGSPAFATVYKATGYVDGFEYKTEAEAKAQAAYAPGLIVLVRR